LIEEAVKYLLLTDHAAAAAADDDDDIDADVAMMKRWSRSAAVREAHCTGQLSSSLSSSSQVVVVVVVVVG